MSSPTLSFGYGTILDHDHWCAWCQERQANPDAISPVESAWLPDRELAFTLRAGIEGGGVLNVRTRLGQVVSGVLFSTSVEGIELLDAKEGTPSTVGPRRRRCLRATAEDTTQGSTSLVNIQRALTLRQR